VCLCCVCIHSFLSLAYAAGAQPVSCGQRLLWALAGSGMTALAIIVYFTLVVPFSKTLFVSTL